MANKSKRKAKHNSEYSQREAPQDGRQLSDEIAACLKQYARDNPGTAALWCLGVGFVLGWKMKPW